MENKLVAVIDEMSEVLDVAQLRKLQEVMLKHFAENSTQKESITNDAYLKLFLDAKKIEGCSDRTIACYRSTVDHFIHSINEPVRTVPTETIRAYLADYHNRSKCSKVTVDNIRRNISSFFSWLEEEDYILKSPMRRIHKIKTAKVVKQIISDEGIEILRDSCSQPRDLAIIDMLYSTGMRVGELVNLNITDINFEQRECLVWERR